MAQTKKRTQQRKAASTQAASNSKKHAAKKTAGRQSKSVPGKGTTKKAAALALLNQKNGTTLAELMAATGWQAHSVRGFLSGTVRKRMGLALHSNPTDAGRVYSIEREDQAKVRA